MKSDDHLYLDAVELSERGWTETMIRKFLGAPAVPVSMLWKPSGTQMIMTTDTPAIADQQA